MSIRTRRSILIVAVILGAGLAVAVTAGHPHPVAAQEPQTVAELGASHEILRPGECALVEWVVHPAGDWIIRFGDEPVEPAGHREVCPQTTTLYSLRVETPDGPIVREVVIRVGDGPEGEEPPGLPDLPFYFQVVDPEAIPRGACARLAWEAIDAEEGTVFVDGERVEPAGSKLVCPEETTRYELLVERPEGVEIREVILHVVDTGREGSPEGEARPPEPEAPPPQQPVPAEDAADVRPSDLYADRQPQGVIWGRITNDGHATLSGHLVEVSGTGTAAPRSGGSPQSLTFPPRQYALNIAPGQTETINLGWPVDTSLYSYQFQMQVRAVNFTDPNPANNSYAEAVVPTGAAAPPGPTTAPPAQPPAQPVQPQAPGVLSADVKPADLYPDRKINGTVWTRITNRGPDTLQNKKVGIFGYVTETPLGGGSPSGKSLPEKDYVLNIAPGQEQQINLGWPVDLSKNHYDFSVTVKVKDFGDPNPGNNTYSERFEGTKPAGPPAIPPAGPSMTQTIPSLKVDMEIYDIGAQGGDFWVYARNNGPDSFTGAVQMVTTAVRTEKATGKQDTLTNSVTFTGSWPAKGSGSALPAKLNQDLTKYSYQVTAKVTATGLTESSPGNNQRTKNFQ